MTRASDLHRRAADSPSADVIVVGAGLAGLAAAVALAADGAVVTLIERRSFVGGRAYSYPHPALNETIDSQHVILGCCTNFRKLIEQTGTAWSIRWYDKLCFLEPGVADTNQSARRSWIKSSLLPAPSHQALSFLRAPMLDRADKISIARGLMQFLRGYPTSDRESFATWLRNTHQTDRAIRHFWEPIIVGALNDCFDNCSTKYAGKVIHESFLRSPEAGRLGIPTKPLSEFFDPVVKLARRLGVEVLMNSGVTAIAQTEGGRWSVTCGEDSMEANSVILATDLRQTAQLMQPLSTAGAWLAADSHLATDRFTSAPITTIHLWYDREVVDLDHAVLLDTRIQWLFAKSRIRAWAPERGCYLELVISASWPELKLSREEILREALRELARFFPKVREAQLVKSAVLKEARATFSVSPKLDALRPPQLTAYPGLYIAGDWTATDWPSTMEGAVRSGRMAAGVVAGDRLQFLAPELPATGLMRLLSRLQ
jgi:zeta-carotene desaturase